MRNQESQTQENISNSAFGKAHSTRDNGWGKFIFVMSDSNMYWQASRNYYKKDNFNYQPLDLEN